MTQLDDLLYADAREPQQQVRLFEQGRIVSVDTAAGTCRVTLDAFPKHVAFGPAPYGKWNDQNANGPDSHHHTMVGPEAGDRCLVAFAGSGTAHPWVIAWH